MLRTIKNKTLAFIFDAGVGVLIVVGVWMITQIIHNHNDVVDIKARYDFLIDSTATEITDNQRAIIANQDTIKSLLREIQ